MTKEKTFTKKSVQIITEGAMMVALAQILGYLKLFRLPWGGSITLIMFPILLFAVRRGVTAGLMAGLALGTLQFVFDGGFILGWQSILGDYVLAYGALGMAGVFKGKKNDIYAGVLLGSAARLAVVWITGATLWGEYMPDVFLGMKMVSPWIYSLLYNALYIVPSGILALFFAVASEKVLSLYHKE